MEGKARTPMWLHKTGPSVGEDYGGGLWDFNA